MDVQECRRRCLCEAHPRLDVPFGLRIGNLWGHHKVGLADADL